MTSVLAMATPPKSLSELFNGGYRDSENAVETIITGEPLKPYSLSTFHSIEVKNNPALALPLEKAATAPDNEPLWKETILKGGSLQSGVYELPNEGKQRRYILYLNTFLRGGNEATLIYLEGKATPAQVKKLIKTLSD